ncbi:MAG TPA: YceI family protein [Acidimicrobiales bacterium]|nr:YceI family protein [Acidimicrobiales bacterium]
MAGNDRGSGTVLQEQLTSGELTGTWVLDASRSTAALRAKSMWGLVQVKGLFRALDASGEVFTDGTATGHVTVGSASIDTKNAKRDTHLRSDDFFSSDTYPNIEFRVSSLAPTGDGVGVSGTLTVRAVTRPVSFPARVALAVVGEATLDAAVEIDRSEYGITWNQMGMASMKSTIVLHLVFTKNP